MLPWFISNLAVYLVLRTVFLKVCESWAVTIKMSLGFIFLRMLKSIQRILWKCAFKPRYPVISPFSLLVSALLNDIKSFVWSSCTFPHKFLVHFPILWLLQKTMWDFFAQSLKSNRTTFLPILYLFPVNFWHISPVSLLFRYL